MKISKIIIALIILSIVLFNLPSFAELHEWYEGYRLEPYWYKSYNPLIIQYPNGLILDLIKNIAVARGTYPIRGLLTYSNRVFIEKKATENAIHNLIEESLYLRVDKNRRVYNFAKDDPELKEKIRERIKATVSLLHYRIFTMKRVLQVTNAVQYKGPNSLLNIIFPYLIEEEKLATLEASPTSKEQGEDEIQSEEETGTFEATLSPTLEIENIKIYGAYTGLVIDARGFKVEPAINPLILDDHGNEIYGSLSNLDINLLYKRGKTGYANTPKAAFADYRAGKNPLYIKAIKAERNCNPIVSFKDGYRIIEENKKTGFLDKLYVSIII